MAIPLLIILLSTLQQECVTHAECSSGCCGEYYMCMDTPSPQCNSIPLKSPCNLNSKCSSHYCNSNICEYYSAGRCHTHEECLSGYCYNGYCGLANFTTLLEIGSSCYSHFQCKSSYCLNQQCVAYVKGPSCLSHSSCQSAYGCCLNSECVFPTYCYSLEKDMDCDNNFDCQSFICKNGKCTDPNIWNFYLLAIGLPVALAFFIPLSVLITKYFITKKTLTRQKQIDATQQKIRNHEITNINEIRIQVCHLSAIK